MQCTVLVEILSIAAEVYKNHKLNVNVVQWFIVFVSDL